MLNEEFPDDVLKLRPRKLRLGQDIERLLEGACRAEENSESDRQKKHLRPNADSINAVRCAACGQVEYITRDYCRCGHYLAGQVMDEYLAWEHDLVETHDRFAVEAEERMKPVRWATVAAMPFLLWPLIQSLLNSGQLSLTTWLWFVPGMVILGLCALTEKVVTRKRNASAHVVENATFEQFLTERIPVPSN
ncbi:hypothetical protein [Aestuariivita sp.]|uniref:hypothetical protein n=1 Tax=Aestuariivita sp. TaxID=1872407 RepID=UPI0021721ED2|nr:hypothetical protein [Aestuariivita sp.]MCE8006314.1 hypothetical protein [Aestuariivita sp.]